MTENTVAEDVKPAEAGIAQPDGSVPYVNGIPLRYAGFKTRMYATVIDLMLMILLLSLLFPSQLGNSSLSPETIEATRTLEQDLRSGKITGMEYLSQMNAASIKERGGMGNIMWDFALQTIVMILYFVLAWKFCRPTPGKRVFKLALVDADTFGEPSRKQLIIRFLGYITSSIPLGFGFWCIGWHKRKQGWHDMMANTVVIHTTVLDPNWKQKQFKRQCILAVILLLGLVIYNRIIRQ